MTLTTVELWADGACSGNPGPGGWAALLRTGEHERVVSGGEAQTTNNKMELTAVLRGLEALRPDGARRRAVAERWRPAPDRLLAYGGGMGSFRASLTRAVIPLAVLALAGCGSSRPVHAGTTRAANAAATVVSPIPQGRPQAIEPVAGVQAAPAPAAAASDPVGDPNAHAPSLSQVQSELKQELVAVKKSDATYIDPLQYVNHWERTDQGVDANMPVGAPILAPTQIKILAIEPDWYAGQPLVYWELLDGPDAGQVQYVAEEITDIAQPGLVLQRGQVIARYAASGTGIEFGWSTPNGTTLAVATSGYEEGQVTPAGVSIRQWLNALGAHAGPS
jgi:RNase H